METGTCCGCAMRPPPRRHEIAAAVAALVPGRPDHAKEAAAGHARRLGPASKKSWLVLPLCGVPSPNSRSHRPVMAIRVPFGWSSCPR